MEDNKKRIEDLVEQLNKASAVYYNGQDEMMSNYEWDAMFDELTKLENETGYVLSDSPTQRAGFEEEGSGEKEEHEYPALSLAKTKQVIEHGKHEGNSKADEKYPGYHEDYECHVYDIVRKTEKRQAET